MNNAFSLRSGTDMPSLSEIQDALYSHKCLENLQEESKQMSCQYLATLISNGTSYDQVEKEVADLDLDESLSAWIKQQYYKPKFTPISFDAPSAKVDYSRAKVSRKFGSAEQVDEKPKTVEQGKSLRQKTETLEKSQLPDWNCARFAFT